MSLEEVNKILSAFDGKISEELAAKAKEANLIPKGHYQFQLHSWSADTERTEKEFWDAAETNKNLLYKHPVANLRLSLLSRSESAKGPFESFEKPRTMFLRVTPDLVTFAGTEQLLPESRLFGDMTNVAKSNGTIVTTTKEVIEYFLEHRGVVHVDVYEAGVSKKGKSYEAGNRYNSIKVAR